MYKMYDKAAAIREIQLALEYLNLIDDYIAPSGEYDERTKNAVIAFQTKMGIPITGKIDYLTYSMIYESFEKASLQKNIDEKVGQKMNFPFSLHEYGEHIYNFNIMLLKVLDEHHIFHSLRKSMYFSTVSQEAVLSARRLFGMGEGNADILFYNRLLEETEFLNKHGKNF